MPHTLTPAQYIGNITELPAMPQVASQVMRLIAEPDVRSAEIERVILMDQALSAQILKISNSAIFGMMREVKTLSQAIMTLGLSTIKCVAIASSTKSRYAKGFVDAAHRKLMWEHSMTVAIASGAFARLAKVQLREEAFLAGLLHDVGKTILSMKNPKEYEALLRQAEADDIDCCKLEQVVFGFDHAEIGAAFASHWNLPDSLSQIIRWHHEPKFLADRSVERQLACIALGNAFAHERSCAIGGRDSVLLAETEAQAILKLKDGVLEDLREQVEELVSEDGSMMMGIF